MSSHSDYLELYNNITDPTTLRFYPKLFLAHIHDNLYTLTRLCIEYNKIYYIVILCEQSFDLIGHELLNHMVTIAVKHKRWKILDYIIDRYAKHYTFWGASSQHEYIDRLIYKKTGRGSYNYQLEKQLLKDLDLSPDLVRVIESLLYPSTFKPPVETAVATPP